jgi:PHP family Zn ribbon phosphoesterase
MIEFKPFGRMEVVMDDNEKNEIITFFRRLSAPYSYEMNLQKCYNHHLHFVTTGDEYDMCKESDLKELIYMANSDNENDKITVFGKKHTNFHISYALFDTIRGQVGMEVRDTYISVKLPNRNRYYHILVSPPETRHSYLNFILNNSCDLPSWIIFPNPTLS